MKIAIDINDVIRDFSNNFVRYYIEGYNHEYDLDGFELWSKDLSAVLPFKSEASYNNFVYNDYAFELFAKCNTCSKNLTTELDVWSEQTLKEMNLPEDMELMLVSTMEYGNSIGYTYFFISKLGTKIREIYMPSNSEKIWDRCDVLITADPYLLDIKPEGKISVKIETEYNAESDADFTFSSLTYFMKNNDIIEKIFKIYGSKK